MLKKLIWFSTTTIKRNKTTALIFITLAFSVSAQLFLAIITFNLLNFPEVSGIKTFFLTSSITSIILLIALLPISVYFYYNSRRQYYNVFKIYGVQNTDIILTFTIEIFILTITGALIGVLLVIILIKTNIIFLPDFFSNIRKIYRFKLIKTAFQEIFGIGFIVSFYSYIYLFLKFRKSNQY